MRNRTVASRWQFQVGFLLGKKAMQSTQTACDSGFAWWSSGWTNLSERLSPERDGNRFSGPLHMFEKTEALSLETGNLQGFHYCHNLIWSYDMVKSNRMHSNQDLGVWFIPGPEDDASGGRGNGQNPDPR